MSDPNYPKDPGDVTIEHKYGEGRSEGDRRYPRTGALEEIASSVRDFASRLPDQIGRAVESAQGALRERSAERGNAITVQVDDVTQSRIDVLVEAGLFRNRSESAAFLIGEGLKARGDLFNQIGARISEIERLRSEMRAMVTREDATPGGPTGGSGGPTGSGF